MDEKFRSQCMDLAIDLCGRCVAEDGSPRPKVSAVLAKGNDVLATAFRGELHPGEHAEFTLLKKKLDGPIPDDAHLFVTLEPCSGRSPGKESCAAHIIEAGIKKVTIGTLDPNPQIYGRGQQKLMEAGVEIDFFNATHASRLNTLNDHFYAQFSNVKNSMLTATTPSERYLVLFCGPSSSGKDTLLSRIRGRMIELGIRSSFAKKYTTRPSRPGETLQPMEQWNDPSSEYQFVTTEEFNNNSDLTAKYEKYGYQYGFSGESLRSNARKDRILFAIYGDIEILKKGVPEIERISGRKCLVYLLRTDLPELENRLFRRHGFEEANMLSRLDELRADYALIERLIKNRGNFKYFSNANVDNPDSVSELMLRDILYQINMIDNGC